MRGTTVGMTTYRLRRAKTADHLDDLVEEYLMLRYKIVGWSPYSCALERRGWGSVPGHVLCAALTAWWTCLFGNLLYAFVAYFMPERVVIKVVGHEKDSE